MPEDTAKTADSNPVAQPATPDPAFPPASDPAMTPSAAFPNAQPVEPVIPAPTAPEAPEPAPIKMGENVEADIAASPIQTPPAAPAETIRPEVVSNPEKSSNNNLVIIASVLLFVGVLGVFGYFIYNMMMPKTETTIRSNQPEPSLIATPLPTPTPTPTVDEMMTGVNSAITGLDQEVDMIDNQLKDRQGDLAE